MPEPLWSFTDSVPLVRAEALLSLVSFAAVLNHLRCARVAAFEWRKYREARLRGCHRAEFLLIVDVATYDEFFNAPVGLRAQYAIGEEHGEAATRLVLSMLEPKLLAFPRANTQPTEAEVRWSLAAPQAKIWIDEDEVAPQLGESNPRLLYPRWQQNSETGVGLLAPVGNRLIVFGGWLDSNDVVRNNPDKAGRRTEIGNTGYS